MMNKTLATNFLKKQQNAPKLMKEDSEDYFNNDGGGNSHKIIPSLTSETFSENQVTFSERILGQRIFIFVK